MDISRLPALNKNNFWFRRTHSDAVIVFVHGVLSSSRTCWLYENPKKPEEDCYWPELIEKDSRFLDISLFLGGYDTAVDAGPYEIRNCVDELFAALNRSEGNGTPSLLTFNNITFVCHSMGGIVARSMIERHRSVFAKKNVGLVLIASPTYGSEIANSLGWLIDFFNNQQGQNLRWGSWSLEDLDDRFRELLASKKVPKLNGVEFYENRFVVHRKWLPIFKGKTVVTKQAQGRYFGSPKQIPQSDHFTICKPTSNSSLVHQYLYDFVKQYQLLPNQLSTKKSVRKERRNEQTDPNIPGNGSKGQTSELKSAGNSTYENSSALASIKNYPAVQPYEIPYEVIEIFAQAFSNLGAAIRFIRSVNRLRLTLNHEGNNERQIIVLETEFPASPTSLIDFWSEILVLSGGKSKRTLATFLFAPDAPIPEMYGPHAASVYRNFQYWITSPTN